ncbi:MAG: 50S ribosomal protein L30 [Firmicutes bacterium]|nr:50S ribosomal protein L30 [Bacillota bacterium]
MAGKLIVTLKRGLAGKNEIHKATVRALGLRKPGQSHELPDNPAVRGMIEKVKHLVEVREA